jgi:hypothetical protein
MGVQPLEARISELERQLREFSDSLHDRIETVLESHRFVPNLQILDADPSRSFMAASTCTGCDFLHPEFFAICRALGIVPRWHRKLWEWTYVVHKLDQAGMLCAGKRGVVFGVGQERLPAYFASRGVTVVATDAPHEIGIKSGWASSAEHSSSLEQLRYRDIVSDAAFEQHVSHRFCDMTRIDANLRDFDFTWSSCCLEHLGSLEAGLQFIIDSIGTLRRGGVACHTTEFNLSSNDETLSSGPTVLYRKRDLLELIERLRSAGHEVAPLFVAPDSHFLDFHLDLPPYAAEPHLKLRIAQYVTTSIGIIVRKG